MASRNEIIDALLARAGAVVRSVEDPMVIAIETNNALINSVTTFSVFNDGRISVVMHDLDDDQRPSAQHAEDVHAQYRAEHVKIQPNGMFEVMKAGWV